MLNRHRSTVACAIIVCLAGRRWATGLLPCAVARRVCPRRLVTSPVSPHGRPIGRRDVCRTCGLLEVDAELDGPPISAPRRPPPRAQAVQRHLAAGVLIARRAGHRRPRGAAARGTGRRFPMPARLLRALTCLHVILSFPQRTASPQQALQEGGTGSVVQLYRYPGLTNSKAKTLLRKASASFGGAASCLGRAAHEFSSAARRRRRRRAQDAALRG